MRTPRMVWNAAGAMLALLAPLAADAAGRPVRAFLLAGQSNMAGSGNVGQAPEAWRPLTGVLFDETTPGNPGSVSGTWETIGPAVSNMGPEMGFAAALREAYPAETIAIIKVSQAATGLGYWRTPGQAGHDTLMARVAAIRDRLDASVAAAEIPAWSWAGFLWMQGENEADGVLGPATTYQADFQDLAAKVRAQTATVDLPVVLARISIQLDPSLGGPVDQPQLDHVRAAQVAWASGDGHGAWVDTDDLSLIDAWHFGSRGQLTLGRRFAQAWFNLVETRPLPVLRRASGQAGRSHASAIAYEVVFNRPVSGLDPVGIALSGDTGANAVEVAPAAPFDGTTYRIRIGGMTRPGILDLSVAGASAHSVTDGRPSLPALGEGTAVIWSPHREVAGLLAYEPFSPVARKLDDLQSGSGWNGTGWDVQNDRSGYTTGETGGFTHPVLLGTPAHGTGGDTYVTCARAFDLEQTFAPYLTSRSAGAVDLPGTTLWLSYLLRPLNAADPHRVALLRGTGSTYSNNTVSVYQSGGTWRLLVLTTEVDTGIAVTAHQTFLMVLRLQIGGASESSSAHLWINPAPGTLGGPDPAPATATASLAVASADFKFSRVHWYPGSQANAGKLDEIRLGTTHASVTPVAPPPILAPVTSLSVNAGGQLLFSFRRDRADLVYTILQSDDLATWEPFQVNPGAVGHPVEVLLPAPAPVRFYRLQLEY